MAYFLGLLIGGGDLTNNHITIKFPYKGWAHEDFNITPIWFDDSVTRIVPIIERLINANAAPRYVRGTPPRFYIEIESVPQILYNTLSNYGITPLGELRRHASIQTVVGDMDDVCKKRFLSGLADVIGSCRASHRHRTLASTIISFEIYGENWKLPFELCQLLHSIDVPVDQILWNHPNMHAGSDEAAYWKKGHKVRVKSGDFAVFGYGLECKKEGLDRLLDMERQARGFVSIGRLCPNRTYRINRMKVVHNDENSASLPEEVRGHFIHYTHLCYALGCPHVPISWLNDKMEEYMP